MTQGTQLLLLTMFVGTAGRDIGPHLGEASRIYARHGISLVAWPFQSRPVTAPYQELLKPYEALVKMTGSINHYDEKGAVETLRKWVRFCYPSLVSYMCPVVFCRIHEPGKPGATFTRPDHPKSLILLDTNDAEDYLAALAHEIGHAAGLGESGGLPDSGHAPQRDNLMYKNIDEATGTNLFNWQLDIIRRCHFARPA